MLVLHISIAIFSLLVSGAVLKWSDRMLLKVHYALIAATVVSGTGLIFLGYSLTHLCIAGSLYLVFAIWAATLARKHLAYETKRN